MHTLFPNAVPLAGFVGGLMIGVAAAIMLLGLGRIAGVSGQAANAVRLTSGKRPDILALAFILGLPLGAALVAVARPVTEIFPHSLALLVLGGLLVGFGTRLGSGCTSGHGVCGLSRLSPRSMVATGLFMGTGFVTVALLRTLGRV